MYEIKNKHLTSSPFGFSLPSGIATAYQFSSSCPIFNIRLPGTTSPIFSFTTCKNLLFGLPLFLFLGNSISIIFFSTYSWSLLMTCPYYLSLPTLIFIPNRSFLTVPLISFITLMCYTSFPALSLCLANLYNYFSPSFANLAYKLSYAHPFTISLSYFSFLFRSF